jgi:tRNA(Phe) wybutosine-synthesizing methylase Tyw3
VAVFLASNRVAWESGFKESGFKESGFKESGFNLRKAALK